MDTKVERLKRFAEMHKEARIKAKKSQEYMALNLGVTKKTISNWEKGFSSPTFFQSLEWFKCLNTNPFPCFLRFCFPEPEDYDGNMDADLVLGKLLEVLPESAKLAIIYILIGDHGASANAIIQMTLAHLHCPIKTRLAQATLIAHDYEIEKMLGNLICQDDIMPDMEVLNNAISKAFDSTINHQYGYNSMKEE